MMLRDPDGVMHLSEVRSAANNVKITRCEDRDFPDGQGQYWLSDELHFVTGPPTCLRCLGLI